MFPAARITDNHTCPMWTALVPHIGGPILPPGAPTVLIGMMPAARLGDMAVCAGAPSTVAFGSPTVLIMNQPAARLTDLTAHGGVIVGPGCPTVLIGGAAPPAPPPPPPPPDMPPDELAFMMQGGKSEEDLAKMRAEKEKKKKKGK